MKARNPIEWAMVHWRIVAALCFILVVFGGYSLWGMPRQEFPQFTIREGLVVAVMPGATSREVEEVLVQWFVRHTTQEDIKIGHHVRTVSRSTA